MAIASKLATAGILFGLLVGSDSPSATAADGERVTAGLQVLYDFRESDGNLVRDHAGAGEPIHLKIDEPKAVRRSPGTLEIHEKTLIASDKPATRLIDAIRRSGELTLETWVRPAKRDQSGPARILTLSKDTGARNFTLGQDGDRFDVRLRTTKTDGNGIPSLSSPPKSLTTEFTHAVYTRNRNGRATLYIDGNPVEARDVPGEMSNWDGSFRLALANELTRDRPWLGSYRLVAVYSRALSAGEVRRNFEAGPQGRTPPEELARASRSEGKVRVTAGLQALYDFRADDGDRIRDRSGAGEPIDLKIGEPKAVRRSAGTLEIHEKTLIASEKPPTRLIDAVRRSGEFTLETWVRPAKRDQSGPARILTLSKDTGARNFTLGQDGDRFDVRLRTTKTSTNGMPSLSTPEKSLSTELTHVVYTRDRKGAARIYINGKVRAERNVAGDTTNWDGSFRLALGNELSHDRPWQGTYHLVAIYSRDLRSQEVEQNFEAGARAQAGARQLARGGESQAARLFNTQVASIFTQHCLECHDTLNHKGELDLSRKAAALAGGENGKAIVPGKAAESLLWQYVESDEMPQDRAPLSTQEKNAVRKWLDSGADWTVDVIDPAIYAHGSGGTQNWLRRHTVSEYIATVRGAVGVDIEKEARELLPPDLRADGFSNTAYNLSVDLDHVEAYARLAEIAVDRMDVKAFAERYTKGKKIKDDKMREFVADMGKWVLRGPLDEHEISLYAGVATTVGAAGGSFEESVAYVLEAMLQSPRFLYRVESQQGDGTAWPLGDYELASRMSYIIWGGPPDQELMRAAAKGELLDDELAEAHVRRMLQDPRAIDRSAQFVSEWLNLNRLKNLRPNLERFPKWDPRLADDMREESIAFFKEVVWKEQRPLADLLNAQFTFATPRLAAHYGLKPAADKGEKLSRYDLSGIPGRGGLLTQAGTLTVGGDDASMVTRGLFVMHDLLRGVVKDPPPCVDTTPVRSKPGLTQRAVAESRIANAKCGGCHAKFEPLAFGLEKFDGIGAYSEKDKHGNVLRDDGEILFPGSADAIPYRSSAELMDLLAESQRVRQCLTWKVAQFALGRPLGPADAPEMEKIHARSQRGGGTYSSLITAIVMSDLVRTMRTEQRE